MAPTPAWGSWSAEIPEAPPGRPSRTDRHPGPPTPLPGLLAADSPRAASTLRLHLRIWPIRRDCQPRTPSPGWTSAKASDRSDDPSSDPVQGLASALPPPPSSPVRNHLLSPAFCSPPPAEPHLSLCWAWPHVASGDLQTWPRRRNFWLYLTAFTLNLNVKPEAMCSLSLGWTTPRFNPRSGAAPRRKRTQDLGDLGDLAQEGPAPHWDLGPTPSGGESGLLAPG